MPWQIPVLLRIILGHIVAPNLIKRITSAPSRARNLVWQYFLAAALATSVAILTDAEVWDRRVLIVAIIGAFNAFACYCHWRAVDISLSKTSLFTQADDFIAIALGYLVLHEEKFLGPWLAIGIISSLGAVLWLTSTKAWATKKNNGQSAAVKTRRLVGWVILYSVIWGGAIFSMRYFAVEGMSLPSYIASWYGGSLIGALVTFAFAGKKERGVPMTRRQILNVLPLAITIWLSLMTAYWSKLLAPITVVQPILLVTEMIFPTIIGLWIFKETKELNNPDRLAFAMGLVGGLIIALSF